MAGSPICAARPSADGRQETLEELFFRLTETPEDARTDAGRIAMQPRREDVAVNRALWLLLGLQLRGWPHLVTRSLGTVKGVLLAAVGLGVFLLWFGSLFLTTGTPAYTHDQIRE